MSILIIALAFGILGLAGYYYGADSRRGAEWCWSAGSDLHQGDWVNSPPDGGAR